MNSKMIKMGEQYKQVLGFIDEYDEFIEEKVYIDRTTDWCYVYTENNDKRTIPTFYKDDNGNLIFIKNNDNTTMNDIFSTKNIFKNISIAEVVENTDPNTELYDAETMSTINSSSDKFQPPIKEKDDLLKKCIKGSILISDVDTNRYKYKLSTNYEYTNMKSILTSDTKVSIKNFEKWMDYLGLKFTVIVSDKRPNGHKILEEDVVYDSEKGLLNKIVKKEDDIYDD